MKNAPLTRRERIEFLKRRQERRAVAIGRWMANARHREALRRPARVARSEDVEEAGDR